MYIYIACYVGNPNFVRYHTNKKALIGHSWTSIAVCRHQMAKLARQAGCKLPDPDSNEILKLKITAEKA